MKIGEVYVPRYAGEFEMELISVSPIKVKCIKTDKGKGFKVGEVIPFKSVYSFLAAWKPR